MDEFYSKVNLGRHLTPDIRPPGHRYFRGRVFEKLIQKLKAHG